MNGSVCGRNKLVAAAEKRTLLKCGMRCVLSSSFETRLGDSDLIHPYAIDSHEDISRRWVVMMSFWRLTVDMGHFSITFYKYHRTETRHLADVACDAACHLLSSFLPLTCSVNHESSRSCTARVWTVKLTFSTCFVFFPCNVGLSGPLYKSSDQSITLLNRTEHISRGKSSKLLTRPESFPAAEPWRLGEKKTSESSSPAQK